MTPPRLPRWLIERAFDRETSEALTGDLMERFEQRAAAAPVAARLWFWRQAVTSVAVALVAKFRRAYPATVDGSRRRASLLSAVRLDARFAFRSLRRSPAFAGAAVATLAIGIGASSAIGTAAHQVLLRPLPYPEGNRLVFLGHPNGDGSVGNVGFTTVVDWRARLSSFDELAIIRGWAPTLVTADGASPVGGLRVNWNYFRMLGVRPAIGRDFEAADDAPDHWRVLIISDRLWRTRFHARADIAGASIEFNGRPYTIVGVLPASYEPLVSEHFYSRADVWAPLGYALAGDSSCRSCQHLRLLGRLRPDATLTQALKEAAVVHADLRRQFPSDYTERSPVGVMLHDEITRSLRRPLQVLFVAVVFVLLVASTNVAGLLLARAADREREFALRAALGAGRGRLIRQLVTESALLATTAAIAGLFLARGGLVALTQFAPIGLPTIEHAATDPALVVLGLVMTGVALVGFGLLPVWFASRPRLECVLRTARLSAGGRSLQLREWLMAGQIAVSLLLIAGAGLMYRTVDRLLHVDPGFDARNVFSASVSLVGPAWAEDSAVRTFQDELLRKTRALPGVEAAALAGQIPLGDNYDRWGFHIEGRTYASDADAPDVERYGVTPDYFFVMRIPLHAGRLFTDADVTDGDPVMIINDTAARTLWPGASPVGAHVRIGGNTGKYRTVVGVVGDTRHYGLGTPPGAQMYVPQRQMTDSYLVLVARAASNPAALAAPVRQVVTSIARDVPVYDVATLEDRVDRSVGTRTFLMFLLGLFATTTIVMGAVGLYGIVSQGVTARRREFGIRLALGAARRDITWLAARRGLTLVAAGVGIGLVASTLSGRLLASQLYETTPGDPVILGASAIALLAVACLAHLGPVRRAVGLDPATTLRNE